MNSENKELNLFNIIEVILNNKLKIFLPSIFISFIFFFSTYFTYLENSKTNFISQKYYLLDDTSFELNYITKTLNKINANIYLSTLLESLDTSYIDFEKTDSEERNLYYSLLQNSIFKDKKSDEDKAAYFNKSFFNKQFVEFKKNFRKYNFDFRFVEKPQFENEFEINLTLDNSINIDEIDIIMLDIQNNLNLFLKQKIDMLIKESILRFRTNTLNLVETVLQINSLIEDSFNNEIAYKIDFLKEQKELAQSIGLNEYDLNLENRGSEFISNEEYLKGVDFIQKKIDILKQRSLDYSKIPQVKYINTLIDLLRSNFFEKQITNEIDSSKIEDENFKLINDYDKVNVQPSNPLNLISIISFSFILFLLSVVTITTLVLLYQLYKKRD